MGDLATETSKNDPTPAYAGLTMMQWSVEILHPSTVLTFVYT